MTDDELMAAHYGPGQMGNANDLAAMLAKVDDVRIVAAFADLTGEGDRLQATLGQEALQACSDEDQWRELMAENARLRAVVDAAVSAVTLHRAWRQAAPDDLTPLLRARAVALNTLAAAVDQLDRSEEVTDG